jgi:hypothetical protein
MKLVENYRHHIGSHCESGSLRNLLGHAGLTVSEQLVFGIGSGIAFVYVFFVKGPSTFPLIGLRNRPSRIVRRFSRLCGLDVSQERFKTVREARERADALLEANLPAAISVDMFYMKYLPPFLRVHAPAHFIVLVGRDDRGYAVSDPYSEELGILAVEDLEAAWETHASMAVDNLVCHVRSVPQTVDFRTAAKTAIRSTCRGMLLPPVIRRLVPFVGIQGMRMYARKIREWPARYRGSVLREGIMFNAVTFEDQGTGGGAFRLMYGAFLQELSAMFRSPALDELAERLIAHGQDWRRLSRQFVVLGRRIPMDNAQYDDWFAREGKELQEGLNELSARFLAKADFEERFFNDLLKTVSQLE